jgi:glycosyltransferase involved in cell wall biosynthesis
VTVRAVHQFHSHSRYGDAITNSMFFVEELLVSLGFESQIFVQSVDPVLRNRVTAFSAYQPHEDQVLLLHHAGGLDCQDEILHTTDRKILVYHNITPPEFFMPGSTEHELCTRGLSQLAAYRGHVQAAVTVSEYNARDLSVHGFEIIEVIPLLLDVDRVLRHGYSRSIAGSKGNECTILFVGSITPHKSQHELVHVFRDFMRRWDGPARLVLVGGHNGDLTGYYGEVRRTIEANSLSSRVILTGQVDDATLYGWYRAADVFVCLSKHEGFCVPLLESMAFDVPVIAHRSTAIPGTLGHAGLMIDDRSPGTVAEAIMDVLTNRDLRQRIVQAQRERLDDFSRESLKSLLFAFLAHQGIHPPVHRSVASGPGHEEPVPVRVERGTEAIPVFSSRPVENKVIRVGWVSTYYRVCGIAEYSRHLLRYFDSRRFEIQVYDEEGPDAQPDPQSPGRFWKRHSETSLAHMASRIVADGIDCVVVQFHFSFFRSTHMAGFFKTLRESKTGSIMVLHHIVDLEDSTTHMADAMQTCNRIFVHARNDLDRLRSRGMGDRATYFPHGAVYRRSRRRSEQRIALGLTSYDPIVGSYGFLLPHKGIRQLIQAMPAILRRWPRAFLLLVNARHPDPVSAEEHYRCQEEIDALNLHGNVVLIDDFLDPEESLYLLEACDVLIFPYQSSHESHSGAITLAMSSGSPVLATKTPIFSELEDVVGFLPGSSHGDIASGVLAFLEDRSLQQAICDRQLDWLRARDWRTVSETLQDTIKAVVDESRR